MASEFGRYIGVTGASFERAFGSCFTMSTVAAWISSQSRCVTTPVTRLSPGCSLAGACTSGARGALDLVCVWTVLCLLPGCDAGPWAATGEREWLARQRVTPAPATHKFM